MWAETESSSHLGAALVGVFPCESLEKWVTWAGMNRRDFLIIVFALNCEEHFSTGYKSFGIFLHILLVCPFSDLPLSFTALQNIKGSTGKWDTFYRIWFVRPIREV